MEYDEAKAKLAMMEAATNHAWGSIPAYEPGPMGLAPDWVRATPEWKTAHVVQEQLYQFRKWIWKRYGDRLTQDTRARIAAERATIMAKQ